MAGHLAALPELQRKRAKAVGDYRTPKRKRQPVAFRITEGFGVRLSSAALDPRNAGSLPIMPPRAQGQNARLQVRVSSHHHRWLLLRTP